MSKSKWLKVCRFRTIGDRIPGGFILDLSYFCVSKTELQRKGLKPDDFASTENHMGNDGVVNIHFMSGHSVTHRNLGKARYQLIKEVSDAFEEVYGMRLWVQKDLNDTHVS